MKSTKRDKRIRRKLHIRKTLSGTSLKPRIFVFRSNKYMYVGAANDDSGKVLLSLKSEKTIESCTKLGAEFGAKLKEMNVTSACFDRSGYAFHGRLEALVNAIRSEGIKI